MRRALILSVVLTVALSVIVLPTSVAAQDESQATPAAHSAREGHGVPAEDCQVEPRSSDELFALLGLAEGAEEAAPAARTPVPAPPWTAADKETAAAAEATAHEWLACINADDNLRLAALMSDAALTRFFAGAAGRRRDRGSAGEPGWDAGAARGEGARPAPERDRRALGWTTGGSSRWPKSMSRRSGRAGRRPCCSSSPRSEDRLLIDDIVQFSVAPAGRDAGSRHAAAGSARSRAGPHSPDPPWDATSRGATASHSRRGKSVLPAPAAARW